MIVQTIGYLGNDGRRAQHRRVATAGSRSASSRSSNRGSCRQQRYAILPVGFIIRPLQAICTFSIAARVRGMHRASTMTTSFCHLTQLPSQRIWYAVSLMIKSYVYEQVVDVNTGNVLESYGANRFYMPHGLTIDAQDNCWFTDVAMHQV